MPDVTISSDRRSLGIAAAVQIDALATLLRLGDGGSLAEAAVEAVSVRISSLVDVLNAVFDEGFEPDIDILRNTVHGHR